MRFEDIDWHDQKLVGVNINRTDPGNNDSIELKVVINGKEIILLFEDVYFADLRLNFGVIAEESISYAVIKSDDEQIDAIQNKWSAAEGYLNDLLCFELNTNSTNSLIKIYALSCKLTHV